MKALRVLIPILIVVVIAAVAVAVYLAMNPVDTTLEFQVRDAVSKSWVWDATFTLENRVIRAYYQSADESAAKPIVQRFTHLKPGEAQLLVEAPAYVSATKKVKLKRGENRLEQPIDLVGYEIPTLSKFIVFEDRNATDIIQEIRPVSADGPAVLNHPCLDLWIGARVSVQMYHGMPAQQQTEQGSERGEELYKGALQWSWDSLPETTFRYGSHIPLAQIKKNNDPYWVIDYLIVVPDPRKITREELESIMKQAWQLPAEAIEPYLAPYKSDGKLTPYVFTSWNVAGGRS
jgi:hypothetical protein